MQDSVSVKEKDIIKQENKIFYNTDFISQDEEIRKIKDEKRLSYYLIFWSVMFLIASIVAAIITKEGWGVFDSLKLQLLSPAKLVTDYFRMGSLASTFLNASLCGFGCNFMIWITKAKRSATLFAGYFLVIAHCFYGLNFVNMWLPFFGIFLYALCFKKRIGDVLHLSMFATSLGPFISDFLFRYTLGERFVFGSPQVTWLGIVISVVFSIIAGFMIPALLNGMTRMHRGYNLYKAGLAIGFFGFFAHALFYKSFHIATPDAIVRDNAFYEANPNMHYIFVFCFFVIIFLLSIIIGFIGNGNSFKGFKNLWKCDGWQDDFPVKFGMPLTLINIGIYGLSILFYFTAIILLTTGVGFTGPTTGGVIAAITFSASGQTTRNVWPIAVGYIIFMAFYTLVCYVFKIEALYTISSQAYISAFAFATGLCPFAGRYGIKYGIIAGFIDAIICTSTVAIHGGFVLYNGGFTAGFAALLFICILDFYNIKPKDIVD